MDFRRAQALPLTFIANRGQVNDRVRYYIKGADYTIWLTPTEVVFDVWVPDAETGGGALHVIFAQHFFEANPVSIIEGSGPQSGIATFVADTDRSRPHLAAPMCLGVIYRNIWDGIDMKLLVNGFDLEQEFIVSPGFDSRQIRLEYRGVDGLSVAPDGSLIIKTVHGELRECKPRLYQECNGRRRDVSGSFELYGEAVYGFAPSAFDEEHELVIDPTLSWSRYVGGSHQDYCNAIATDTAGNVYLTGGTRSWDFPISAGAVQPVKASALLALLLPGAPDAFITKIDPSGTVIYSTYLGGSEGDIGHDITVDDAGNVYVVGITTSSDFPTVNALQATRPASSVATDSAFVAKIDATGSTLVYSTYLGGSGNTVAKGIAVDSGGHAYIVGQTDAHDFPTANAIQPALGGGPRGDAFITKLAPAGDALVYSTYLGGSGEDGATGVAVDDAGHAYVTGFTHSLDFPTTPDALQLRPGSNRDPADPTNPIEEVERGSFVAKFDPTGSALLYSTYLGREFNSAEDIALDASGNIFVVGRKEMRLMEPSPPQTRWHLGGRAGIFVTKLDVSGSFIHYDQDLGVRDAGIGDLSAKSLAVDDLGRACVTGGTASPDFPAIDPIQVGPSGNGIDSDAFVVRLDGSGAPDFATYYGGSGLDEGTAIALGPAGEIYVAGRSGSMDLRGAVQMALDNSNGFLAAIAPTPATTPTGVSVARAVPDHGADTGTTSVTLHGTGFTDVTTVTLTKRGVRDIIGRHTVASPDGTRLRTTLDLTGAAQGSWDLVVTHPTSTSATLPNGFTVEAPQPVQINVDVTGPGRIRPGRPSTFTVVVSNRWNRDALLVPLWISGIPSDADVELQFDIAPLPAFPEGEPLISRQAPPVVISEGEKIIPLLLCVLPAGATASFPLTITAAGLGDMHLQVGVGSPLAQSEIHADAVGCLISLGGLALDVAAAVVVPHACAAQAFRHLGASQVDLFEIGYQGIAHNKTNVLSIVQMLSSNAELLVACAEGLLPPPLRLLMEAGTLASSSLNALMHCAEWAPWDLKILALLIQMAIDPNEKFGPLGAGSSRYVREDGALTYGISFENLESATAPAQEVTVTDQLDTQSLDIGTLALGDMSFGDVYIHTPPGLSQFTTEVDLRPGTDLLVRVEAALEPNTGLLTWHFISLDPATGNPPDDPMAGFLPPNLRPPEGQGAIQFACEAKKGLPTGTQIRNAARIVFDQNAPIATQEWINTMDNSAPTSRVHELAKTQRSPHFAVTWSGTDDGSGINSYTIFVSENGGPFVAWMRGTAETTAQFEGKAGSVYGFYSLARDAAGNVEQREAAADAVTRVAPQPAKPGRALRFEIYADAAGQFRWRLIAPNGAIIASSGEAFSSKAHARRAANRVRLDAAGALIAEA